MSMMTIKKTNIRGGAITNFMKNTIATNQIPIAIAIVPSESAIWPLLLYTSYLNNVGFYYDLTCVCILM